MDLSQVLEQALKSLLQLSPIRAPNLHFAGFSTCALIIWLLIEKAQGPWALAVVPVTGVLAFAVHQTILLRGNDSPDSLRDQVVTGASVGICSAVLCLTILLAHFDASDLSSISAYAACIVQLAVCGAWLQGLARLDDHSRSFNHAQLFGLASALLFGLCVSVRNLRVESGFQPAWAHFALAASVLWLLCTLRIVDFYLSAHGARWHLKVSDVHRRRLAQGLLAGSIIAGLPFFMTGEASGAARQARSGQPALAESTMNAGSAEREALAESVDVVALYKQTKYGSDSWYVRVTNGSLRTVTEVTVRIFFLDADSTELDTQDLVVGNRFGDEEIEPGRAKTAGITVPIGISSDVEQVAARVVSAETKY